MSLSVKRSLFLAALLLGITQLASGQTARIGGTVRDTAGRPIEGAEVSIRGVRARALTNAQGVFNISGLEPGQLVVEARRVGFSLASMVIDVRAGEDRELTLSLVPELVVLPEIEVAGRSSKPARYASTTKYDDFFRRRRSGAGTFLTRDDIERMNAFHTHEVIRQIPGVRVSAVSGDPEMVRITFSRCTGGRSNVAVYIDGERLIPSASSWQANERGRERRGQGAALAEMLSRISVPQIEMVEVYRGTAEIPGELNEDACAVIFLWTRWNPERWPSDSARKRSPEG
jgi:hypothetical protein